MESGPRPAALFAYRPPVNRQLRPQGWFLDALATAQKDWAKFVQRRITENVAVTRQLLGCQCLADAQEIYAQYLETAFHQYREQSQKSVQRSETMAQHLAETTEANAREAARTYH